MKPRLDYKNVSSSHPAHVRASIANGAIGIDVMPTPGSLDETFVFKITDEDVGVPTHSSQDDDGNWIGLDSPSKAQVAAERLLRERAVAVLADLGLHAQDLERLGVRRVPEAPTQAGETTVRGLFEHLRQIVEAFGPVWIEGVVRGVRSSRGGNVYFTLRDGETSAACRISSTLLKVVQRPRDGELLRVRAVPTIFEMRGEAQLDVIEAIVKGAAA